MSQTTVTMHGVSSVRFRAFSVRNAPDCPDYDLVKVYAEGGATIDYFDLPAAALADACAEFLRHPRGRGWTCVPPADRDDVERGVSADTAQEEEQQ